MKKIILTIIGLALAPPAWSAQTAVTQISGTQASIGALKSQVNTKLGTVESNRQDHETRVTAMETGKETKAVVQASAPADTTVDWYDTDQETGVLILKRHNGTTWLRASSHGVQYLSNCLSIPAGFCVDTDDGKLYYHNNTSVVEVGTSGGSYTLPTASSDTLGGIKVGTRLSITDGVLSADVQTTDISGKENSLGNPSTNGYVLSSTTSGVRSWVEMTGGGTGIAHATADGNYYASKDGGWANLSGVFAPPLGVDDNYVTDAEKTKLSGVADGAEVNVNADWNASSGDAQILNKPTIPVFPTCTNDEDIMEWDTTTSAWVCKTLDRLTAGTGITITENGGGPGVDTVNVTPNTYQAYDADWLGVTANGASLISAANYAAMRALLDLEVGVDFNAYDSDLTIYAGITPSANVQSLLGAANYAAIRSLLDLEAGIDFNSYDADLTTWAGVTPGAGIATFLATPSGANLATALTSALPASKGGTGLTALGTGVSSALSADIGAVNGLPKIVASGTYTVDTASISANTCASAVDVTASGVTTSDIVIVTPNAILSSVAGFGVTTAGSVRVDVYPTDVDGGKVNFQFCNPTGAAIDPGSVTFNWKVIR